ncbi:MAG: Jag N-terminal domain-containing protein [Candidatus Eisenbacteria bacterium]|nr:Jag N-terminal domain-containing protein [Candidatus Eisenbacteria bacterium]
MAPEGAVFEGRTLDDAVRKGLEALGLSRAEVMITIVEEGSGGFLGIGARPYRVRVMARPGGAPRDDQGGDRREGRGRRGGRDRDRSERGRGREERRGGQKAAPPQGERRRHEEKRRDEGREKRPAEAGAARSGNGSTPRAETRPGPRPESRPESRDEAGDEGKKRRRRGRRGGRGRREGAAAGPPRDSASPPAHGSSAPPDEREQVAARYETRPAPPEHAAQSRPEARTHAPDVPPEPAGEPAYEAGRESRRAPRMVADEAPALSSEQLAAEGKRLTEEFLAAMGFEATVTATAEETRVDVTAAVASDDELLTGRKGEVRQALQHLLNRMLNRGEGSRYHLQLEVNEFWKRREEELRELARSLADQALATGAEMVTEYLNSQERRIVHVTLKDDQRVKTYALGDGMIKRVAIAPADFEGGPRDE